MSATISSYKAYPEPFCRHAELLYAPKNSGFFSTVKKYSGSALWPWLWLGSQSQQNLKHLFYCRAIWPDGHVFQSVSKMCALQRLPLTSFDQTDRMDMLRDCAELMGRPLKSMNWIKTQMLVCFDGIFFFFWLRCFLEIKLKPAPNLQLLGLYCLSFLYFAALTYWPAWLIFLSELLSFLFLTVLPHQNTTEKQKSVQFRRPVRSRV